jgi:7-cyano-7-deazaguanine synthase
MDSTTCLAIAIAEGFQCHTLAFDYGQRHRIELALARKQSRMLRAHQHKVIRVDLRAVGGSALTAAQRVPKGPTGRAIPSTYVPARNAIFLSLGLAWAEVLGAEALFIGANQVDFSGYPDCRREFLRSFERMANLATRCSSEGRRIRLRAPLLDLGKAEIIRRGARLGVDYGYTHSCYDPVRDRACGRCPACRLRLKGFAEAGMTDPAPYVRTRRRDRGRP